MTRRRRPAVELAPAPEPGDADITEEDIARADAHARRFGDELFNAMLDATPDDEPPEG